MEPPLDVEATASDVTNLSENEKELVQQFIHELSLETAFGDGIIISEMVAVKFLMARKFELGSAISLFYAHRATRGRLHLLDFDPTAEPISSELKSGKFTVLKGKGKDGVTICVLYGKKHNSRFIDHVTVLRAIVFQLDFLMKCLDVQRNGLALIYDMTNSAYANFDFDLAMKVLHLLKGGYPARLKHIYVLSAPLWFRTTMAVLATFLKDKIRDRIELVKTHVDLQHSIPKEILPEELGGTSEETHADWISQCINGAKTSESINIPETTHLEATPEIIITDFENREGPFEPPRKKESLQDKSTTEVPSSPDISPPPIKTQRTDKPPDKPLPPPPGLDSNKPLPPPPVLESNAENISTMLNDTMNEMEKFLQHNNEHISDSDETDDDDDDDDDDDGEESNVNKLIHNLKVYGKNGVRKEYEQIKSMAPIGTFVSTLYPVNLRKNRYNNILAFEESRVKLEIIDNDPFSDYINANYVDGYSTEKKFICAQGPLPHTFCDFWRMIWEHKVVVIVMVTRCVERGRVKCGKYWPENEEESMVLGDLTVTNVTCDTQPDFTSTLFELHNSKSSLSRRVCHIQITSWPDFGVLSSAQPIIDVIDLIQQYQEEGVAQMCSELNSDANSSGMELSGDYQKCNDVELSGDYEKIVAADVPEDHATNAPPAPTEINGDYEKIADVQLSGEYEKCEEVELSGEYEALVGKELSDIEAPPIVIHCSAGVGRTGTFCCISNCIESYEAGDDIDVLKTVENIRSERAFSVQTAEQYHFCYTGILEYIVKGRREKGLDTTELQSFLYAFSQTNNPNS